MGWDFMWVYFVVCVLYLDNMFVFCYEDLVIDLLLVKDYVWVDIGWYYVC